MNTEEKREITEAMLVDFIDGKLAPEQMAEVERWYDAAEENRKTLEQLYFIVRVHDMSESVAGLNPEQSLADFKRKVADRDKQKRCKSMAWVRTLLRYTAAVLVCAAVVGGTLYFTKSNEQCEICADSMQNKSIVLPDKSKVELKANSTITFDSNFTKNRVVRLDGEALFDVVKMNSAPFVVKAKGAQIVVKGTKFNFKAYSDCENVEAVLINGAVDFTTATHNVALKPNQKAVYNKGSRRVNIVEVDAELEVFGQRYFDTEPLGSVVNSLEQVYDCRISFSDARIEDIRFSGTIDRSNTLDHTLNIVTLTTGTSFRREGDAIIIDR
ncbi:MAG: DUF4974 domain-containing protein [Alistipes sp.]|nr:DUF4974 domain-containing protein [Alistipes sp.]